MYICMNNAPQYVVREIVGEEEGEMDTDQKEETVQKKQEKPQEQ